MPTLLFLWWNSEPTLLSISSLVTTNYFMSLQPKTIRGVAGGMVYYMLGEPSKVTIATPSPYLWSSVLRNWENPRGPHFILGLAKSPWQLRKSMGDSSYVGGKVIMATETICSSEQPIKSKGGSGHVICVAVKSTQKNYCDYFGSKHGYEVIFQLYHSWGLCEIILLQRRELTNG